MVQKHKIRRKQHKHKDFSFWGLVLLFSMMVLGLSTEHCGAGNYDLTVRQLLALDQGVHGEAKEELVKIIKRELLTRDVLGHDPELFSENIFQTGHFINPKTLDVAVGVSYPPREGNLVVLTQKGGRYRPIQPITHIGFVESMRAVKLFPGFLDQLVLNLIGGGSGWKHWGQDIYRWDGKAMRMIWAWVRRDWYVGWPPSPQREVRGRRVYSGIVFKDVNADRTQEIMTSAVIEEGVLNRHSNEFEKITSRFQMKATHRWEENLFYYVAQYGEIIPSQITVECWQGSPTKRGSAELHRGRRVGILQIPGGLSPPENSNYQAVIGKEHWCGIPKPAVRILP